MDNRETIGFRLSHKSSLTLLASPSSKQESISSIINFSSTSSLSSESNHECDNMTPQVTIFLTESCASELNLDLPHLDFSNTLMEHSTSYNKEAIFESASESYGFELLKNNQLYDFAYIRTIDLEESSGSFEGMDDLSQSNIQINMLNEKKSNFKITPVLIAPLSIVRSTAHRNNLEIDSKKQFYVSVVNKEISMTESGWINLCRICYGSESLEQLVSPCRCRGSIALAHHSCLERWLRESLRSRCELCLHHYQIIREPKYSIMTSIFIWLFVPAEHSTELIMDILGFCLYTPTALFSTYVLLLTCDSVRQHLQVDKTLSANMLILMAICVGSIGMAAIDFAYTSWLIMRVKKNILSWRRWWYSNCHFTLVIPKRKTIHINDSFEENQSIN